MSQRRTSAISLMLALLAAVSLSLASCTRREKGTDVDLPSGEKLRLPVREALRINLITEPSSLDWHRSADSVANIIISNVMEGLTQYDLKDKDLSVIPALAEKLVPSEQARKWKITLRRDVLWSDDVPFVAQHVADGWRRVLDRETASEYSYALFGIKNAQAFNEGKTKWEDVGVKVVGAHELAVELERPMSYFPAMLTHHSTYPIRLDTLKKRWTDPPNMVTLGPFVLKAWQHDKLIVLERNGKYYGEKPSIRFVVGYMLQEQATAINLFESGALDSVHSLPSIEIKRLRGKKEFHEVSKLATYYYGLNTRKAPTDNVFVRRALAQAIDRQELVQMLAGGQLPLTSWVPAGMFGYEAERGLSFNPEKARALLKRAGYTDPAKFPRLEIRFNTNEDHLRIAENIQAQLKRNLDINVELKNVEWKVFLNDLHSDPPSVFRMGWQADYPDPDNFMVVMTGVSENNYTRWKNPRYDELVARAAGTVERDERRRIYSEAQKLLLEEDVPAIPLFTSVNHALVSERVENYPLNSMEAYLYKGVRLKK